MLFAQEGVEWAGAHTWPHAPQACTLAVRSTSQPSRAFELQSAKLGLQEATWQVPCAHTGDALATPWSFSHATADIASVRFTYSGSQNFSTGVAFDNFTFDAVPEPDTIALVAVGLCVGAGLLRRKRRHV